MTDTIFALSSGAVPSGVAVIRLSGPRTLTVVKEMCGDVPPARRACLRLLKDPQSGTILDEVLVLVFEGPASFTGEDVAEFHCHGGRAVVAAVLETLSDRTGCRPAEPGEFTRRAFEKGRLDLTEVEGLADLIAAETEQQRRQALRQMGGALGILYEGWRARLIHMRAMIEAEFDFADEEDVPGSVADLVWGEAAELAGEIESHLKQSKSGERLRNGLQVVLMGAPNAGKSSLLNALAGRDVAIVTEEAGTTRDVIEVHLDLGGYPVTLADTAGLRETEGRVEQEGIRRARARGLSADLILWAREAGGPECSDPATGVGAEILDRVPVWTIATKQDLSPIDRLDANGANPGSRVVPCSVETEAGIQPLLAALTEFAQDRISVGEAPLATRARHRHYLQEAVEALSTACLQSHLPMELRAEDLRQAADALGRITGRIDVEDLLDVIFREFCIGK
ncbi:tRNA modification GTPase MnmE [Roseibium aquae]|uniref:tRNA modification GTPase MnmE n=1 Tax=Roseibium aquae TaxID=1323746 RepID=A0A916TCX2_9HYPH|nr:tRNA uridine-5-carboxymethylaminomethyl(34) synthesis GTPase MnmE [Roseibium aquae]GGB40154.1 tRNA modification GTPase MnmE [Roseibium aquae]